VRTGWWGKFGPFTLRRRRAPRIGTREIGLRLGKNPALTGSAGGKFGGWYSQPLTQRRRRGKQKNGSAGLGCLLSFVILLVVGLVAANAWLLIPIGIIFGFWLIGRVGRIFLG
jgi:hypothetical protein